MADYPAVEVEHLSKAFGGVKAVTDVSFALEPGTVTGLIGPNGAGKTTMLNLITGYLKPTSGSIRISGVSLAGHKPHEVTRAGVARTYQNILLLDSETVATNVLMGSHRAFSDRSLKQKLTGWRDGATAERVQSLLADLDLLEVAEEEVAQLPYGVRRRVEIARALANSPSVLILDEPTAGMTREESDDIGELVARVQKRGTTVLLVEHNVRLVSAICNDVLVFQWGQLIARESAAKVWENPTVRSAYLGEVDGEAVAAEETKGATEDVGA